VVQQVDQQIKQTQEAIEQAEKSKYVNVTTDRDPTYEFLRQDIARTQADLAFQKATATATERTIATLRQKMVELDQKGLKQADLVRENKANEANYLLYLSKREQERTSDALDKKRIANVALAIPPSVPALPVHSAPMIAIVGLFLSFAVGMGAAYLAEYMDPSFRTPAEVVEVLKIPLVVAIPKLRA
jgi:succinoglycan biosynthesis transport protein ExoP